MRLLLESALALDSEFGGHDCDMVGGVSVVIANRWLSLGRFSTIERVWANL